MSDLCEHCVVRGNIKKCMATPCQQHDSWFNSVRIERIEELETAIKTAFDCATIGEAENALYRAINVK